ncbi:MlrC C-terminal domain-containing protein [Arthrobacter sp. JCM 19049]|uniref:MlrC C-terminal domain-containing protein n=1 Tax=Arthrobacter sp. JCM 19049 TaxID=1460643 RepID=UPI0006D22E00|nr:MlrC C-terminal domain-containing protein [Arthrobacter sp. JCM 19049]
MHAIITERRKPYHTRSDFAAAGLQATDFDLVVVKIGYLEPELFDLAEGWMLALTPGGVDQDLLRLGHRKIERPMFRSTRTWKTRTLAPSCSQPARTEPSHARTGNRGPGRCRCPHRPQ